MGKGANTRVDPRLGTWDDVRALGETVEIVADLIENRLHDTDIAGDNIRAGSSIERRKIGSERIPCNVLRRALMIRPGAPEQREMGG